MRPDPDGTTAFTGRFKKTTVIMVDRLIKAGANVNARNDYGSTRRCRKPPSTAMSRIIERLLKAGADAESPNADGQTPLMAIARTSNVDAARCCSAVARKSMPSNKWREQTPLMWAAAEGQAAMVKVLVAAGADVNARSTSTIGNARSPPRLARSRGRPAG